MSLLKRFLVTNILEHLLLLHDLLLKFKLGIIYIKNYEFVFKIPNLKLSTIPYKYIICKTA